MGNAGIPTDCKEFFDEMTDDCINPDLSWLFDLSHPDDSDDDSDDSDGEEDEEEE